MQLTLAFLDPPDPPSSPPPSRPSPTAWDQLDEAARIAALELLARLIARMMVAAPLKEVGHE
jgi:hypothetical protein